MTAVCSLHTHAQSIIAQTLCSSLDNVHSSGRASALSARSYDARHSAWRCLAVTPTVRELRYNFTNEELLRCVLSDGVVIAFLGVAP
jgi:hypothetical protein